MKTSKLNSLIYYCLILVLYPQFFYAQDPFFIHFHSNAAAHNPSLVGYSDALSLSVKYKTQWNTQNVEAFQTAYVSLEESLPCSIFDYGFSFQYDEEGPGLFRTYDLGFRFAGTIPFAVGNAAHNIRLGGALQWSQKRIDYSQFIFSDQLDPKYGTVDVAGTPLPTNFIFPDDNTSLRFFTPSIGISHRMVLNETNDKSPSLLWGFALHNNYPAVESILRNTVEIPKRWTAFAQLDLILYNKNRVFVAFRPMVMHQRQSQLEYWEVGARLAINRLITVGMFTHFNERQVDNYNSRWLSFLIEMGEVIVEGQRVDLGFSFSNNFSGLKNHVGPILEFSFTYHFQTSPTCKLANAVSNRNQVGCHLHKTDKSKIYENIWYKTINSKWLKNN